MGHSALKPCERVSGLSDKDQVVQSQLSTVPTVPGQEGGRAKVGFRRNRLGQGKNTSTSNLKRAYKGLKEEEPGGGKGWK